MSSISSVSGQVAVAVGFLTRDPSLIWNTERWWLIQDGFNMTNSAYIIVTTRIPGKCRELSNGKGLTALILTSY